MSSLIDMHTENVRDVTAFVEHLIADADERSQVTSDDMMRLDGAVLKLYAALNESLVTLHGKLTPGPETIRETTYVCPKIPGCGAECYEECTCYIMW